MGTIVEVVSPRKEAAQIVFTEISRIDKLLSVYNPDSEISLLNNKGKLSVSQDTMYIIRKSKELYKATGGAFDITVEPLVRVWGFEKHRYILPEEREITKVLRLVGSDKIILNESDNVIKFKTSGMKISLGAIAKGYAVDLAVAKLKETGIKDCLINAGGDIYCLGNNFGRPWKVAIRDPRKPGIYEVLELEDKAVATSGDYEQYFIKGSKRYAHIFDPRTGYPVDEGVCSVTVIASDCLTADALATSIFVLGKNGLNGIKKNFKGYIDSRIIECKDNVQDNKKR